jgi:hypothetical protein
MTTTDVTGGKTYTCTPAEWRTRTRGRFEGLGKPTTENLAKYVAAFEASTQDKGCNAHLGVQKVIQASILDQDTWVVVATFSSH